MLVLHQFLYVLSILRCTFYAFSGTNLLTRCHSASSCFLLFLVSEKLHRKYSRNWTKQIAKFLISRDEDEVRRRGKVGPQGGHTMPRRGSHLGRVEPMCGALMALLRLSFGIQVPSDKIGASVKFRPIPRIFTD